MPSDNSEDCSGQQPSNQVAEVEATLAAYREWVADGRPGAMSHEEAMAELLRGEHKDWAGFIRHGATDQPL